MPASARLRTVWWTLHRWIGLALIVLLIPISVSGSLLVWHDHLDALLNPARYAISGAQVAQPAAVYLARAADALPSGVDAVALRFPEQAGWPVTVMGRGAPLTDGGPMQLQARLSRPADRPRTRCHELAHVLHRLPASVPREPDDSAISPAARSSAGLGAGMLILSLTGIWLWWPRNGAFLAGLRWRRAPRLISNLHNMVGFWIAMPLAVVSLTGIYLSFPQAARSAMASVAPMSPQAPRPGFAARWRATRADHRPRAGDGLASEPGGTPAAIFLPTWPPARVANRAKRAAAAPAWRLGLARSAAPRRRSARHGHGRRPRGPAAAPPIRWPAIRAAQWMRWIHEGSRGGPVWQVLVFLTGLVPAVLGSDRLGHVVEGTAESQIRRDRGARSWRRRRMCNNITLWDSPAEDRGQRLAAIGRSERLRGRIGTMDLETPMAAGGESSGGPDRAGGRRPARLRRSGAGPACRHAGDRRRARCRAICRPGACSSPPTSW